jgi:hypothetical protein
MITTYGIYILTRKDARLSSITEVSNQLAASRRNSLIPKFNKEAFIGHGQIDYIEVSLGQQAFQLVCINKRQNCWVTTASKHLTQ